MARKPTGADLSTPRVPRKSRSPSARHDPLPQLDLQRRCDGLQGHPRAGDEGFEEHVAGAELGARAAARRMQAGNRERAAGLDLAGDALVVQRALRLEGDDGGLRLVAIAVLQRRLQGAESGCVHLRILDVCLRPKAGSFSGLSSL